MPAFLDLNPGQIIWTLINFSIFVFIIGKYGWRPMMNGLAAREKAIHDAIQGAEDANAHANAILKENKENIAKAQAEMMSIVRDGKTQSEALVRRAAEEASAIKLQKVKEAERDIDRQKEEAIKEIREEVSNMVVTATEKLIGRTLQTEDHKHIVENYVNELSKN